MRAPQWMNAIIGDFGRGAGVGNLAFNDQGALRLDFENGFTLQMEYVGEALVVSVTLPAGSCPLVKLMMLSHPKARYGFRVRTALSPKTGRQILAVVLGERDVTLPRLNDVFGVLWRLAREIGGSR